MAIFVTGLTGGAAEENDITVTLNSDTGNALFSNTFDYPTQGNWDITINENITDITNMFSYNRNLEGTILLNCNATSYEHCFYHTSEFKENLTVNYTSLCVNINAIIQTRTYTRYVTKGSLVVV